MYRRSWVFFRALPMLHVSTSFLGPNFIVCSFKCSYWWINNIFSHRSRNQIHLNRHHSFCKIWISVHMICIYRKLLLHVPDWLLCFQTQRVGLDCHRNTIVLPRMHQHHFSFLSIPNSCERRQRSSWENKIFKRGSSHRTASLSAKFWLLRIW